jgi:hypothetical protein
MTEQEETQTPDRRVDLALKRTEWALERTQLKEGYGIG